MTKEQGPYMEKATAEKRPTAGYKSLTQIILETLRDRVFNGEYGPGDRLNISDLASQFDVSPVPVREALRNLQSEGLADFVANRGFAVSQLSAAEARELFLLRFPLEFLTTYEASRVATPADIKALRQSLPEMEAALGTERWHVLHEEFHLAICEISKLQRFARLIETYRGKMRPYSKMYLSQRSHLELAHKEHKLIVDAIEAQNTEEIKFLVRSHLTRPARIAMATLGVSDPDLDIPL